MYHLIDKIAKSYQFKRNKICLFLELKPWVQGTDTQLFLEIFCDINNKLERVKC